MYISRIRIEYDCWIVYLYKHCRLHIILIHHKSWQIVQHFRRLMILL